MSLGSYITRDRRPEYGLDISRGGSSESEKESKKTDKKIVQKPLDFNLDWKV